jgi:hypothetical protein
MDFINTLWLPILLSAVFVFIVSSVIHMFLGYHVNDMKAVPNEDATMDKLRDLNLPPGNYAVPKASSMKEYGSEAFQAKVKKGPVMFLTVRKSGEGMGKALFQWFLYSVVVSVFCAYLADYAVDPGGNYLDVFRVVGCAGFMGYSLAMFQDPIWVSKNWGATLRSAFDGLLYGLVTAGTFGWLWH